MDDLPRRSVKSSVRCCVIWMRSPEFFRQGALCAELGAIRIRQPAMGHAHLQGLAYPSHRLQTPLDLRTACEEIPFSAASNRR